MVTALPLFGSALPKMPPLCALCGEKMQQIEKKILQLVKQHLGQHWWAAVSAERTWISFWFNGRATSQKRNSIRISAHMENAHPAYDGPKTLSASADTLPKAVKELLREIEKYLESLRPKQLNAANRLKPPTPKPPAQLLLLSDPLTPSSCPPPSPATDH